MINGDELGPFGSLDVDLPRPGYVSPVSKPLP